MANLTPEQIEEIIQKAVDRAVTEAMTKAGIVCACGLTPVEQRELGHFMGVLKHLGGDTENGYAKGAEVFRQNSRFVLQWRDACETTGNLILRIFIMGLFGVLSAIGLLGLKEWFKKGGP